MEENLRLIKFKLGELFFFNFENLKSLTMKVFINLALVIIVISLNSCCGNSGYPVAAITIEYVGEFTEPNVYQIRTAKNDMDDIIDTTIRVGAYSNDGFKIVLFLNENENSFILIPMDSSRVDTISKSNFSRGKCDAIENLEYQLNGIGKTSPELRLN